MTKKSAAVAKKSHNKGGVSAEMLRTIVERIERLEEEKAGIAADVKDVYCEAKGNGFDVPTIRKCIRLRKQEASQREEEEHLLHTYMHALGMLPLFEGIEDDDPDDTEPA